MSAAQHGGGRGGAQETAVNYQQADEQAMAQARVFSTRSMRACSNDNGAGHDRRNGCRAIEKNFAVVKYFFILFADVFVKFHMLTLLHTSLLLTGAPFIICDLFYGFGT
jgi:hypothetical protein